MKWRYSASDMVNGFSSWAMGTPLRIWAMRRACSRTATMM